MTLTLQEMEGICKRYAPFLRNVPSGIEPGLLLWALSGCESSFGKNCTPRFEKAYFVGGLYATSPDQAKLLAMYGRFAACSYGPFQIMLVNAIGYTPTELSLDSEKATEATVAYINRRIFSGKYAATNLEQFADSYNSGTWRDANTPTIYIKRFKQFYGMGLPSSEVK